MPRRSIATGCRTAAADGETQNLLRVFETALGDAAAAEPEFLAALETKKASEDESPAESLADGLAGAEVMIWLEKNEASDAESRANSARNAKNTTTVQSETQPRKKAKVNAKVSMCKNGEPKSVNEKKEEEPPSDKLATDK